MIYVLAIISISIGVFGLEGRGTKSSLIANIGGWLWVIALVLGFYNFGIVGGVYLLLVTLIAGAIFQMLIRFLFWRLKKY